MLVIVSLPEGTSSRSNMIQVSNRGKKRGCPWAGLSTVVHLMLVRQLDLACCKTGDNLNLMAPYGTDPEEHQVLFKKSQPRILNTPNTRVLLCSFIPASTVVSGGCLIWTREGITNTTVHAQIDDQTVYSLSIHRPGKVILCCANPFSGWWKTDGRCHSTKLILSSKSIKFSIVWSYTKPCFDEWKHLKPNARLFACQKTHIFAAKICATLATRHNTDAHRGPRWGSACQSSGSREGFNEFPVFTINCIRICVGSITQLVTIILYTKWLTILLDSFNIST